MLEKIAAYAVSGKRVFVGIGVSNIVGPCGIAARLTEAGFAVTRV